VRKVDIQNNRLVISFYVSKDEFGKELAFIKSLPSRQFDPVKKYWTIPYSIANINLLHKHGYSLSEELKAALEASYPAVVKSDVNLVQIDEALLVPGLRSYQIEGVRFIETFKGKALLAFAPRLGKSLTSLAWCLYAKKQHILVVCPSISKLVWEQEVKKWSSLRAQSLYGRTPYQIDKRIQVLIINYDILTHWIDMIEVWEYDAIIIDESHYASNKHRNVSVPTEEGKNVTVKTLVKRTQSVQYLASKSPAVICLSGTPFLSYPAQLYQTVHMLAPRIFSNEYSFLHKYCDPILTRWGWEFKGASRIPELKAKLATVMLRKAKEDVFTELPEEEHILIPITIDRKEYEEDWAKYQIWYRAHRDLPEEELDAKILHMESVNYSKKRSAIHEWIKDFQKSGQPLVVFAWFRETCLDLHKAFAKDAVLIYGGTKDRQKEITKFQQGKAQILIGQISATKESITLANSNDVLYAEVPYSAGDLIQSQERVFLPGKEHKNAYYYAVAWDTADEEKYERLQIRVKNLKKVLD
jgi:SWI/SNF-related matrix-associated actin-dependent regulator 1 of chromatin subfamily A